MAQPEPAPLVWQVEETEVPGCAGSVRLVVPKVEPIPEGDGEEPGAAGEPGGLEPSCSEDWLVRKVKVEEEYEEWPSSTEVLLAGQSLSGAFPAAASAPEQPCPEELGYGGLPAFATSPWPLLGLRPPGAGTLETQLIVRLPAGKDEPRPCGTPAPPHPFACAQCGKGFGKKLSLTRHLRLHTGERPFACGQCGRRFISWPTLIAHAKAHAGSLPFTCEQCGRGFSQKSQLARHQPVHTGTRPHACTQCRKRFSSQAGLLRHQVVHTGPWLYICTQCGKSFSRKTHLLRHERTHTVASTAAAPRQSWLVTATPAPAAVCP